MLVPHLSHSSIAMAGKCPRQFYYRYILGLKIPPGAALEFGKAYHEALQFHFEYKISVGTKHLLAQTEAQFSEAWSKRIQNIDWRYEEDNPGWLKDVGMSLVDYYTNFVSPKRNPSQVEYEFETTLPGVARPFVGIIDLIEVDGTVVDHKTSSSKWYEDRAEKELQPCAYKIGFEHLRKDLISMNSAFQDAKPNKFIFDIAIKSKNPTVQSITTSRNDAQIQEYTQRAVVLEDMIEKEVFPKTDPSNWYCSNRWCGYYAHCMQGAPVGKLRLIESQEGEKDEE